MSYLHCWWRAPILDARGFARFAVEVRMILQRAADMGLNLAGPTGYGHPITTENTVAFNGAAECGHRYHDLGRPFPSPKAEGVERVDPFYDPHEDGAWFSGPYLWTRVCGGRCAGEPFVADRMHNVRDWERASGNGMYYCSSETDFKPYDLVVTAALIRLKENLGDEVIVSSDGEDHAFEDAQRLCRELFGWPKKWELKPMEVALS